MSTTLAGPKVVIPGPNSVAPSLVQFIGPLSVRCPLPPTEPPFRLSTVFVLKALNSLTVRLVPAIESVCWPLKPPTVKLRIETLTSSVTV